MSRKRYFKEVAGAPAPLQRIVRRKVRFEEVDPLGIVWHGHYASYFEDGRVALGQAYGIGYEDYCAHKVAAPIKQMQVDYVRPLRFNEEATIEALLHFHEAARLNFEFIIRNAAGAVTTTGCTVQLFLDQNHELLLSPPDFYAAFLRRWKEGRL